MASPYATLTATQRFFKLIKGDRKEITYIYLYAIFAGFTNLTLPLGVQAILNFIQGGAVSASWWILILAVTVGTLFAGLLVIMQMTVSETARKVHEVIQEVEANGKEFVVVRNTQPVARIVPEPAPQTALEAMGDLYGILPDEAGAAWLKAIEDHKQGQRKAKKGSLAELRNAWAS